MRELVPDADQVERFGERLAANASDGMGWALGYMHAWTSLAAIDHASECYTGHCVTCRNLSVALSLFAAVELQHPPSAEEMELLARAWRGRERD